MFDSNEYEFADIRVKLLGYQCSGLRGLTYKKSQEKEHVYAAGSNPRTIQKGNKKYEGTLTLLDSDKRKLDQIARAAGYEDITDVPHTLIFIVVVYDNPEIGLSTDTLIGVAFTDAEDGMKQGDKFKEVELPFIFLRKETKP